jgi:osmoprotectant transport system substrate-binding protein
MYSFTRNFRRSTFALLFIIPLLLLAACGGGTTSTTTKGTITIGGKKDVEAQLFTEMYTQLLRNDGFTVNEKLAFGTTPANFQAIQNKTIDLYAEFTGTALNLLNLTSTYNPQQDYDAIKAQYNQKYQITWLDRAANLNDGYALCMQKDQAASLGIATLSDLASKISTLTLQTPSDGTPFVDGLKRTYNFDSNSFKNTQTVDYAVGITAVANKQADVTVCYGTDIGIPKNNLIFLQDDKNGFPAFNPSPIIRNEVLNKYPEIATKLNALAPDLTNDVSISLQQQVNQKSSSESTTQALKEVVKAFLTSKGLL